MNLKPNPTLTGAAVVLSAAALAGCQHATKPSGSGYASASGNGVEMVHCYGVNACKGMNDCGGASNACKGQGACKGTGFVAMPAKACADIGGNLKDDWRGQISKAELTQCYGVNVCKGHNDCKTANNACKGQAACKGQGFVMTTASACKAVGGTTG